MTNTRLNPTRYVCVYDAASVACAVPTVFSFSPSQALADHKPIGRLNGQTRAPSHVLGALHVLTDASVAIVRATRVLRPHVSEFGHSTVTVLIQVRCGRPFFPFLLLASVPIFSFSLISSVSMEQCLTNLCCPPQHPNRRSLRCCVTLVHRSLR